MPISILTTPLPHHRSNTLMNNKVILATYKETSQAHSLISINRKTGAMNLQPLFTMFLSFLVPTAIGQSKSISNILSSTASATKKVRSEIYTAWNKILIAEVSSSW